MNYFLGIFPDQKSNYKIRRVVREVGRIFKDFGIPVRWSSPESLHISLHIVGKRVSLLDRFLLRRKMEKIIFKPFEISFRQVKLGISRKYRELIYIDIEKGGEEIRNLFWEIGKNIKSRQASTFVPHLTIGRVSKELSEQEYRNLVRDIHNISKSLNVEEISFIVTEIYLVRSKEGDYFPVMKFDANS
ncbi:MAG: 2'-5' RNA ligase family protein [Candidatus Dojkabacteria bacterium]|jgi:2'-5' RNA ligase